MIVFPDLEKLVCGYLPGALAATGDAAGQDVLVDVRIPNPRRERMVIVNVDGGSPTSMVLAPTRLRVRAFARTESEAGDLMSLVEGVLPGLVGEHVNQVKSAGRPVNLPDPSEQAGRLQWFDVIGIGIEKE